jgi:hypothetical protein
MGTQERITTRKPFLWVFHSCATLRFSLGCPFLCAPTVFSGLSFHACPYGFFLVVLSCVPLRFSRGCPFLCAHTVFPGLSTLVCSYSFLWIVRPCVPIRCSLGGLEKTVMGNKKAQPRENRRSTQERTTQRKPKGHTRKDNPENNGSI